MALCRQPAAAVASLVWSACHRGKFGLMVAREERGATLGAEPSTEQLLEAAGAVTRQNAVCSVHNYPAPVSYSYQPPYDTRSHSRQNVSRGETGKCDLQSRCLL